MIPGVAGFSLGYYQMEEPLAAGTMGVVFKARDTRNHNRVAVKVLTPGRLSDQARARIRESVLQLSELCHPNIASVLDFGSHGEIDYLVMEYVFGTTLDTMIEGRPLPGPQVLALGTQLASGLAAAHAAGVNHGDIQPSNLRITPDGQLKIVDFGVATFGWPDHEDSPTPAQLLLATAGTLRYAAPERLLGATIDERADIFSAGAVLYEMACGRPLASDPQPRRLIQSRLNRRPPQPSAINPWVDPAVEAVILTAIDREPRRRYPCAANLAAALTSLQARPRPSDRTVSPFRAAARWAERLTRRQFQTS